MVTCGPGFEPIDAVRRITNASTGNLGVSLAEALAREGNQVYCFKGEMASRGGSDSTYQSCLFSTNNHLWQQLQELAGKVPVRHVFHVAALCDFRLERVENEAGDRLTAPKFSSRSGELRLILRPALKILPRLPVLFPSARVVGWKYEMNGGREDALRAAWNQLETCKTSACVVNGAAYGKGFAFCTPDRQTRSFAGPEELIQFLCTFVRHPPFA